jgi:CubicO group peptidase (beta-lactamase class C family)
MNRRTLASALITVALSSLPGWAHAQAAAGVAANPYEEILTSAYADDAPGAAALVAKGGEIVFLDAAGMADLELGVPLAPDMVFEIGSITKQFTAAAIMMLAEEGKLSISDPITRYLPDYPPYGDGITVEHLLTHTSGIVSYTGIPGYMATEVRRDLPVEDLIDVFKDLPVEFAPGERYAYNNSGYILLGAIIEAVSGMRYQDFVRERIFQPLGMEQSYYGCSECLIPGRASGYGGGENGYTNQQYLSFTQPYAAGSLMMTVEDMLRWSKALFGGEVLSAESLERMTTPFTLNNGESTGYGYGLAIGDIRGHKAIRHGGGIFGFVTDAAYLPDEDVFVAVFSNDTASEIGPGMVATKLAALAVGDPFPTFTEIALDSDVLSRYVGVYQIDESAQRYVTIRDGALHTQRTGGSWVRAYPASETHFFYKTSLSHFEFVIENGEVTAMLMYQNGSHESEKANKVSGEVPTREAIVLDPALLERYVGVYELQPGFDLTVYVDGDRLMTQATGQGSIQIHPESETEFFVEEFDAQVTFVLGSDGTATALILHQGGRDMRAPRKAGKE